MDSQDTVVIVTLMEWRWQRQKIRRSLFSLYWILILEDTSSNHLGVRSGWKALWLTGQKERLNPTWLPRFFFHLSPFFCVSIILWLCMKGHACWNLTRPPWSCESSTSGNTEGPISFVSPELMAGVSHTWVPLNWQMRHFISRLWNF